MKLVVDVRARLTTRRVLPTLVDRDEVGESDPIGAGLLIVAFAFLKDFGSATGESVDPSQRVVMIVPSPETRTPKIIGGVLAVAGIILASLRKKTRRS